MKSETAFTFIPPEFLAVNPAWVDPNAFGDCQVIKVDPDEPFAANTLTLMGTTPVSAAFPKTEKKPQAAGVATRSIDISELQKAEAGLTCLSLILEPRTRKRPVARSAVTPIKTSSAPAPQGHQAQAIAHGGLVYVSAQLPIDPATGRVVSGLVEAQTEQTLNNLAAVLKAAPTRGI
ncbi:MAG: Rid family hydrolase [Opitutaceae bacterium]